MVQAAAVSLWLLAGSTAVAPPCIQPSEVIDVSIPGKTSHGIRGGDCVSVRIEIGWPAVAIVHETDVDLALRVRTEKDILEVKSDIYENWLEVALLEGGSGLYELWIHAIGSPAFTGEYLLEVIPLRTGRRATSLSKAAAGAMRANTVLPASSAWRRGESSFREVVEGWEQADRLVEAAWMRLVFANQLAYGAVLKGASRQSQFSEAIQLVREAIRSLPESEGEAYRLRLVLAEASLLKDKGDFSTADSVLRTHLPKALELGDASLIAEFYMYRGSLYYEFDDFDRALSDWQTAQDWLESDPLPKLELPALANVAQVHAVRGEVGQAYELFERTIALARKYDDWRGLLHTLTNRASLSLKLGRFNEALVDLVEARKLSIEKRQYADTAYALMTIGGIYRRVGDGRAALATLSEGSEYAERSGDEQAIDYLMLSRGNVLRDLGDSDLATKLHSTYLERAQRMGDEGNIALGHLALASDMLASGDFQQAWHHGTQAEERFRRLAYDQSLAAALEIVGSVGERRGEYARAEAAFLEALAIRETLLDDDGRISILTQLARLRAASGDIDSGIAVAYRAADLAERVVGQIGSPEMRASSFGIRISPFDEIIRLRLLTADEGDRETHIRAALVASERARSRRLKEVLSVANPNPRSHEYWDERVRLLESLNGHLIALQHLTRDRSTDGQSVGVIGTPYESDVARGRAEQVRRLEEEIRASRIELDALDARMAEHSNRSVGPASFSGPDVEALSRRLGSSAVLVAFHLGSDASHAWWISESGVSVKALPPAGEIEEAVRRVRDRASASTQGQDGPSRVESDLSSILLAPLEDFPQATRLYVLPDDVLHQLPFAMLSQPGNPSERLATRFEISYLSTLTIQKGRDQVRPDKSKPVLVVADPSLPPLTLRDLDPVAIGSSVDALSTLAPLRYARDEAERLRDAAGDRRVDVLVDVLASKERVLDADLAAYGIVHFATHAIVGSDSTRFTGLVLAGSGDGEKGEVGLLHLDEIYGIELEADLVTLSACQTGQGRLIRGEGPVSLGRAFMIAGAKSVVMTQWDVPDQATSSFMARFYESLFEDGESPSYALRQAQLALIADSDLAHPYFWAGFQLAQRELVD